ncbi:unnamed protein product [Rotaria sordida]|uniref:VOC domain-containing protein n=1 Tax=Rotaria sordida TaxID=392033 RepID=A0A814LM60_9BILA|nr:unnamed protein product [Rotaria sordida]CAF1066903.1 unnamed protein product [Rotaria sordida]
MMTLNLLKFDIISGLFGFVIGFLSLWILFEWRQCKEKQEKLNSMISTIKYSQSLHWNPLEERRGLGDLIVKVNHIAITVSDVGRSISFYVDILGFQQVRRPTFDRHGAWLTMGNIELHLIKGIPTVPNIDDIHVSHIAFETLDINKLVNKLRQLNIDVRQSLLIPNINKSKSKNKTLIYQYFFNDPDGYYLEVCNCHIITEYALNKDKTIYNIDYHEGISNKKIFTIIQAFSHWKEKTEKNTDQQFYNLLKQIPRANQIDENKFKNLVKRRSIHGDLMQLFTDEDIKEALLQTNNIVPLTIKILTRKIRQNNFFQPSSVIDNEQSNETQSSIIDTNHSN